MSARVCAAAPSGVSTPSSEELDNLQRSKKKMKATESLNTNEIPTEDANMDETANSQSYKDKLLKASRELLRGLE